MNPACGAAFACRHFADCVLALEVGERELKAFLGAQGAETGSVVGNKARATRVTNTGSLREAHLAVAVNALCVEALLLGGGQPEPRVARLAQGAISFARGAVPYFTDVEFTRLLGRIEKVARLTQVATLVDSAELAGSTVCQLADRVFALEPLRTPPKPMLAELALTRAVRHQDEVLLTNGAN